MRADRAAEALEAIALGRKAASYQPCEVTVTDPGGASQRVFLVSAGPAVLDALREAGFGVSLRNGVAEVVS